MFRSRPSITQIDALLHSTRQSSRVRCANLQSSSAIPSRCAPKGDVRPRRARELGAAILTGSRTSDLPLTGRTASVRLAQLSVELLVGSIEVEVDAEHDDAVVGDELPDGRRYCDEGATDDQDPIVGSTGVRNWERVEAEVLSKLIDNGRRVDDDEVGP